MIESMILNIDLFNNSIIKLNIIIKILIINIIEEKLNYLNILMQEN